MSDVMMRLRDGIDTIMSAGIDAREASRDEWQSCVDTGVDSIIALVREAMLSELRRDGDDDTFLHSMRWEFAACSVVDAPDADEFAHDTVKHVEKAITVAFGPASDQHEEGE